MTYLYTVAWQATQNGLPPIRPIFWSNPRDDRFWDIEDEFMLGPDILVAPILTANTYKRRVLFPPGEWYSFWDDQIISGDSQSEVGSTINTIPVYIRGGTVLPMEDGEKLMLHIYPGKNEKSTSLVYFDQGDGYGDFRVDTFKMESSQGKIELFRASTGQYPFPYSNLHMVVHGHEVSRVIIDGSLIEVDENKIDTPLFQSAVINIT